MVVDNRKDFIVVGSKTVIGYKEMFPLIRSGAMFIGATNASSFITNYEHLNNKNIFIKDGVRYAKFGNIGWFTSFNVHKNDYLQLTKEYNESEYPKYDNCNAINVDKTKDIPKDYYNIMGVPITFLDKYNQNQFEIVGFRKGDDGKDLRIGGKDKFSRVLIKRKGVM